MAHVTNILVAVYSAAFDLILAALPWKVIIGLQMKPYEKFGLGIAMSFGLLYVELIWDMSFAAVTVTYQPSSEPPLLAF